MMIVIGRCCIAHKSVESTEKAKEEEEEEEAKEEEEEEEDRGDEDNFVEEKIISNRRITLKRASRCARIERGGYMHDKAALTPGTILHFLTTHKYGGSDVKPQQSQQSQQPQRPPLPSSSSSSSTTSTM